MRKVTATEKYRAVNEGQLSKANFLRDMRMAYPSVISQLNGYDTSVTILKNRGLIHEKTAIDSYDSKMELNISPDSIDRGVRYEMQARGKEASDCKDIVIKNLKKDPLHYIMLVAKDSSKVDKHDKEVEVKRGANDVDTFNGLKKADLKEDKKDLAKLLKEGKMSDLAEKLGVDVSRLQDAADRLREMEREEAAKSAEKVEAMKSVIEEEPDEVMNIDRLGREKEDHDSNYTKVKEGDGSMVDEHEHMFFSLIFNKKYDDILDDYMTSDQYKEDEKQLQDKTKQANVFDAAYADHWEQYIKEFEANNYDRLDEKKASEKKNPETLVKENIKSIITKILEEGNVNEAATNQLAKYAEEYSSFQGMKETIIALENIVTEIESFYDKTKGKIQKIYDSIGEVRNEEGLKVGAFIAPSIENAFNRDLRPIVKAGFTKGLDVPKIRSISQAEVDALKNETPVYEEEPKKNVFSPVYESKKKNKKSKK
jgi:hypothetical protein